MAHYRHHLTILAISLLLWQGASMSTSRLDAQPNSRGEWAATVSSVPRDVDPAKTDARPPAARPSEQPVVVRGNTVTVDPGSATEPAAGAPSVSETAPAGGVPDTVNATISASPTPAPATPNAPASVPPKPSSSAPPATAPPSAGPSASPAAPPAPTAPPSAPAPQPTVPPTPPSTTGGIPVGAEGPVPANYRATDFLRTNWPIPASTAHEPTGNFRFICEASHLAYDDPIVAPGQPGASHLHMFFGNTGADANSTYRSLRTTGDSTCQGGPLNRSAYWTPAVFDGSGNVVMPDYISVYYKGRGYGTDGSRVDVVDMPAGLRMIAGAIPGDPNSPSEHNWYCETSQNKQKTIPSCPAGERVGVVLPFPTCWNGTELDSPNHRSHVRYPVRDVNTGQLACPGSHPKSLPEFTLGVWFPPNTDSAGWYLASDRMHGSAQHDDGASFHADWFGAWDLEIQSAWTRHCINGMLNCSWGDLGDSRALSVNPEYTGPARVPPPPSHSQPHGFAPTPERAAAPSTTFDWKLMNDERLAPLVCQLRAPFSHFRRAW